MIFKAPLIAFQSELYAMLSNADEMTFSVYDSSMTISEILNSLKIRRLSTMVLLLTCPALRPALRLTASCGV